METINHECYVSLEVAKLLKKAGFDWKQYSFYNSKGILINGTFAANWNNKIWHIDGSKVSAPTLNITQKWLREVHHLHITVFSSSQESWMFRITKKHQMLENGVYGEDFYTYEEALESGIEKALEMILKKGK